jgi:hypothetical protein
MDWVLERLPNNVGYWYNGCRVNSLAYADDIILTASSRPGLQCLLNNFANNTARFGLQINSVKSHTGSTVPDGKSKKIKIVQQPFFIFGSEINCLGINSEWTYLGVPFNIGGITVPNITINNELELINRGPLKPYQRIEFLRSHLLPSKFHQAILEKTSPKQLRAVDITSRLFIRKWLHLPHDTPNGFFHVPIGEGGLGVPELNSTIGILKKIRFTRYNGNLPNQTNDINTTDLLTIKKEIRKNKVSSFHNTTDGRELRHIKGALPSTAWVMWKANFLSGQEYIQFTRIRAGALPSLMIQRKTRPSSNSKM